MDEEKQFFIDENMSHRDDAECNTCQIDHQQPANRYRGISKRAFMFHVVVFLLYTVVLVGITRPHSTDRIAIDPSVPYCASQIPTRHALADSNQRRRMGRCNTRRESHIVTKAHSLESRD